MVVGAGTTNEGGNASLDVYFRGGVLLRRPEVFAQAALTGLTAYTHVKSAGRMVCVVCFYCCDPHAWQHRRKDGRDDGEKHGTKRMRKLARDFVRVALLLRRRRDWG